MFRNELFQNNFISVISPDRNFRSGAKSGRTFHKYRVKEACTEFGTWINWADQLTHFRSADVFTALSFQNENFYVNVELTICIVQD